LLNRIPIVECYDKVIFSQKCTNTTELTDINILCKEFAESDNNIIIVTLLEHSVAKGWYVKPGVPVPTDSRSELMAAQAHLLVTMVNTNHDYLGELYHIIVSQNMADVILVPIDRPRTLCVLVMRPYDSNEMLKKIKDFIKKNF
jgi:hypothetical protein